MEFGSAVELRSDLQGVIDQAGSTRDEKPAVATAVCFGPRIRESNEVLSVHRPSVATI
jgi:hypothetical protein